MTEFLKACILPINLPFTILLGLFSVYWLFVILGAIDMDLFHADWMPDMHIDDTGGFSFLEFLGIGDVPVMLVFSVLTAFAWWFSLVSNFFVNAGNSLWVGLGLLIPNILLTIFLTGLLMKPLSRIFADPDKDAMKKIVYRTGTVTTSEVTTSFGQIEIETAGAPITINVRTTGDLVLKKGEKALVYDEDKEKGIYFVEKYNE